LYWQIPALVGGGITAGILTGGVAGYVAPFLNTASINAAISSFKGSFVYNGFISAAEQAITMGYNSVGRTFLMSSVRAAFSSGLVNGLTFTSGSAAGLLSWTIAANPQLPGIIGLGILDYLSPGVPTTPIGQGLKSVEGVGKLWDHYSSKALDGIGITE